MNEKEKAFAYDTLGLKPGATEAEINAAYEKLLAFLSTSDDLSEPLKKLAEDIRAEITAARTTLLSTTSGVVPPEVQVSATGGQGGNSGKLWEWLLLVGIVGGIGYMAYQDQQDKHKVPEKPAPVIDEIDKPKPAPEPEKPPAYAVPYLHSGIAADALKWKTEDLSAPGSKHVGVLAYDSQDRLINYLTFYSQDYSSQWAFNEQWIVRYSANGLQAEVTHFQPKGQSGSYTSADESNVSEVGDVQVRTTIYSYHLNGGKQLLDSVTCSTPFTENYDGLQYERDSSGQLQYVIRKPNGIPVRLEANRDHLDRMFDLWRFFGQYD